MSASAAVRKGGRIGGTRASRTALSLMVGVAVLGTLIAAAPASAATVAYVDRGDVFLSTPDGKRRVAITTNGTPDSPYVLAGTADNGVTVAAAGASSSKAWFLFNPNGTLRPEGPNLVPMRQCGSALGSIGPLAPRLHPSGQLVAYNYFCNYGPPSWGYDFRLAVDNPRDVTLGSNTADIGSNWNWPTWFRNRLVVSDTVKIFVQEDHPDAPFRMGFGVWLFPEDGSGATLDGAEIARTGGRFLVEWSRGETTAVLVGTYSGAPPAGTATVACVLGAVGTPDSATFSPSGGQIAWRDGGGVKVGTVNLSSPNCLVAGSVRVLSTSGSSPRFSGYTLRCIVPRVARKPLRAAKAAIRKAGCAAGRVTRRYSAVPKGRVIRQKPAAGKRVPLGTKVNLVVSGGKRR